MFSNGVRCCVTREATQTSSLPTVILAGHRWKFKRSDLHGPRCSISSAGLKILGVVVKEGYCTLGFLSGETERDILSGADGNTNARRGSSVKVAAGAPTGLP